MVSYSNSMASPVVVNVFAVLMFVNASPAMYSASETLCSLNFAHRCHALELGAAKAQSEGAAITRLRKEVDELRAQLGVAGGGGRR